MRGNRRWGPEALAAPVVVATRGAVGAVRGRVDHLSRPARVRDPLGSAGVTLPLPPGGRPRLRGVRVRQREPGPLLSFVRGHEPGHRAWGLLPDMSRSVGTGLRTVGTAFGCLEWRPAGSSGGVDRSDDTGSVECRNPTDNLHRPADHAGQTRCNINHRADDRPLRNPTDTGAATGTPCGHHTRNTPSPSRPPPAPGRPG